MISRKQLHLISLVIFIFTISSLALYAESAFDFGLPLFGHEDVRFEKSKTPDFNFQLLKKYVSEHQGSVLHQLQAISRWFSLIKLSDTPRRAELLKLSSDWFSTEKVKDVSVEERLREIFFRGLQLSFEATSNESNEEDESFEELLLDSESLLRESPDYFIIKGILFHLLRNRPNNYFAPMKPEEDLKKALLLIPRTAHYYFVLGQAFRFLGTNDSSLFLSIASYEKSASLDPRNPKLQNSLLGIYMGLHEDFQARNKSEPFWLEEAVYKKILTLSPNNPYALNNLGYLYAEYGVNTQLAQDLCQKAVDLSPDNPGFRDSLGWAAFKNKDFPKAEEELKKSLAMRDNVYDPHYHIATLYYATRQLGKAEEHYRNAIALKPDSAEALNNLAYLLAERNQKIDDALSMAKIAVNLEPSNASYLDTMGWLYYRKGQLDKALDLLLKSAQLAPGQGEILMHIGIIYLEKGQVSTSIDYLKQAWKADPGFEETANALYMAIRLKSYYNSLAEYHGLLGKNADKDRICNILMGISRLYQEEKLYEKAIDITRLCADIRSERKSLDEPVLPLYELPETSKNESEKTGIASEEFSQKEPEIETEVETEVESQGASAINADVEQLERVPQNDGYPLVICLGPDFFKLAKVIVPSFEHFENLSITFFIKNAFQPGKGMIARIESEDSPGTNLLQLSASYFSQMNSKIIESDNTDSLQINVGKKTLFAIADRNAVYFCPDALPSQKSIDIMSNICGHNSGLVATIFYDWTELKNQIPGFLRPFAKNPLKPFTKALSRYSYQNGKLNEFSILTTGKPEDEAFLRHIARKLFAFKMQAQEMGFETTIKVRGDKDTLYLSIDIEGISAFIEKRFSSLTQQFLSGFVKRYFVAHRCFLSRMFFSTAAENLCPAKGKIEINHPAGLIECSIHKNMPAIPFFTDETEACKFYRSRLEEIIKSNFKRFEKRIGDENLLNELAKEYNIPRCPTSGNWKLEKNGSISCSDHEN